MWSAGQPRGDPRTPGPGFAVTAPTLTPAQLGRARDQFAALLPIPASESRAPSTRAPWPSARHELAPYWTRRN